MEKKWKPVCGGAVIFGVHTAVVVRVVARSASYFHTGGEGGSFKCFNAADSATSPLLSAWSRKKRITKADTKRRDRARDALEKVRDCDDVKAALAACEFLLAAERVLDEVDAATQTILRTERDARERAAMLACPDDLLFDVLCPCRSINSIPERVRVAGGVV